MKYYNVHRYYEIKFQRYTSYISAKRTEEVTQMVDSPGAQKNKIQENTTTVSSESYCPSLPTIAEIMCSELRTSVEK